MYINFYRVKVLTMRKEFTFYVEGLSKQSAIGVAYEEVTKKYGKPMFVKIISVEEIKPE